MMLELVPDEMRACPQWLLWKPVWIPEKQKITKIPLSVVTGQKASVRSPQEWSDFSTCVDIYTKYGAKQELGGLGFVFGYKSGLSGLDLDDALDMSGNVRDYTAVEIARRFDTYTEVSPSRTGLHGIFKGAVPDGRRVHGIELYGEGRYFTVTGDPYFALPINERQFAADQLREYIDAERAKSVTVAIDWTVQPKYSDQQLWQMCVTASNGPKFFELFHGNQLNYPSPSEAEFALIDIIAHYTDSPTQVYHAFLASSWGKREKVQKRPKYVQDMIARAFDRKVPLVAVPTLPAETPLVHDDYEPHDANEAEEIAQQKFDPFVLPPGNGMVGRVAEYIYHQAAYPMKEAALLAALTMFAGICGRQYQYKSKGLNLYLMLLANTGSGKEAMSTGIGNIMEAVCDPPRDVNAAPTTNLDDVGFPAARAFRGPARLTGKGLMTELSRCDPCSMFSVLNEFADTMRQMADIKGANQGIADLKTALLDLYMKSTAGNAFAGHTTADTKTSVKAINSPAFTFLAECTPHKLYGYLTEDLIADGMLPRLVIFESHGFGEWNEGHNAYTTVPYDIAHNMRALCKLVFDLKIQGDRRIEVQETPEAATRTREFRLYARKRLTTPDATDATRELWNRAHLNVERIAALLAIGVDAHTPVVTAEMIDWAAKIITRQIILLVGKFRRGETGDVPLDDNQQLQDLRGALRSFMKLDPRSMASNTYSKSDIEGRLAGAVSFRYLQMRTNKVKSFRQDKRGANAALRMAIDTAIKVGDLEPTRLEGRSATYYKVKL